MIVIMACDEHGRSTYRHQHEQSHQLSQFIMKNVKYQVWAAHLQPLLLHHDLVHQLLLGGLGVG